MEKTEFRKLYSECRRAVRNGFHDKAIGEIFPALDGRDKLEHWEREKPEWERSCYWYTYDRPFVQFRYKM